MDLIRKHRAFLSFLILLFSIGVFALFQINKLEISHIEILGDNTQVDTRIDITDDDIKKNITTELLSKKTISNKDYYFRTNNFPNGSRANNTIFAIKVSGVVGIDSYLQKVQLLKNSAPIQTDYMGIKIGEKEVLLLLGMEGEKSENVSLKLFIQSVNSDKIIETEHKIEEKVGISKFGKDDNESDFAFGEIVQLEKDSFTILLSKNVKTQKKESKYQRDYRLLTFGDNDQLNLEKIRLINKFDKKELSPENYKIKIYVQRGNINELYNGETKKHYEKLLSVELIGIKDDGQAEGIFESYLLKYKKN